MSNNNTVVIELDRPRTLRFRHKDMKKLESSTGKTIQELDEAISSMSTKNIEIMVYHGLSEDCENNNETLTYDDVRDLLEKSPYFAYPVEKVIQAWRVAFGLPAQPEGNDQPPAETADQKNMTGTKA